MNALFLAQYIKNTTRARARLLKQRQARLGFTLIEAVVSISLFSLISVGLVGLVSGVFLDSGRQNTLLTGANDARLVAKQFTAEIRNATISNTGAHIVTVALPNEIVFYSNLDTDSAVERIHYVVSNGALYKSVIEPSGSPLSYNTAGESFIKVIDTVSNTSALPLFTYHETDYTLASSAGMVQPVNVNEIYLIRMHIRPTGSTRPGGTPQAYEIVAGGMLRNMNR